MKIRSNALGTLAFTIFFTGALIFISGCKNGSSEEEDARKKKEQANRELVINFFEQALNQKNEAWCDNIMVEEVVFHRAKHKGDRKGLDHFKEYIVLNKEQFPDLHFFVEDIITEDGKVVARFHASGIHNNSGAEIETDGIRIFKIENGKIVEIWEQIDDVAVLSNSPDLGLMAQPEEGEPEPEYSFYTGYDLTSVDKPDLNFKSTQELSK
jgi:predicted ester cyclase